MSWFRWALLGHRGKWSLWHLRGEDGSALCGYAAPEEAKVQTAPVAGGPRCGSCTIIESGIDRSQGLRIRN